MTQREKRNPEGEVPGVGLVVTFAVSAALLAAIIAVQRGLLSGAAAAGAAFLGGVAAYFLGIRAGLERGVRARESLREALVAAEGRAVKARLSALREVSTDSDPMVAEERELRQRAEAALEEEQRQSLVWKDQADRAQREIERLSAEARSRKSDERGALREVERLLSPYVEREKLLLDLARIDGAARGGLPDLLDTIAKKAHFASIVLSDESGLPVAATHDTRDPESVAATSSLLFTLADRVAQTGAPAPIAVLVHDEANETILHRLFRADGARFVLTATGRGNGVMPETLDPTLHSIERALLRQPLHA